MEKEENLSQDSPGTPTRQVSSQAKCPRCSGMIPIDKTQVPAEGKIMLVCPTCGLRGSL